MYRIRWIGIVLGLLLTSAVPAQTQLQTDEQTLKSNNLPTDAKGLVDFFEKRSMKEGDAKHLTSLVKKLDSTVFSVRDPATKELISRGPVALPFLKSAVTNPTSLETKRRAEDCIAKIEATMQAEPISAAARVLTTRKDPKAATALFNFVPSVSSDPHLEDEVLACIGRLTITMDKVDPLILNALRIRCRFGVRRLYLVGRRGAPSNIARIASGLRPACPRAGVRGPVRQTPRTDAAGRIDIGRGTDSRPKNRAK